MGGANWQFFETPTPGFSNTTTDVKIEKQYAKLNFELKQNYPNPFNSATVIPFVLAHSAGVRIEIFNIRGERVRQIISKDYPQGRFSVNWDGRNDFGKNVSCGIYFVNMRILQTKQNLTIKQKIKILYVR